MEKWIGAAAICINEESQLLMVLQGKPDEEKTWSIPSGGLEANEDLEQCCLRELLEETGYSGEICDKVKVKKAVLKELNITIEVHYYLVEIIAGQMNIQDPDQLIYDIAWKGVDEMHSLTLSFPEDRAFLMDCMKEQ